MTDKPIKVQVQKISARFEFPQSHGRIDFVSGITTEEQAREWGEKKGYARVYWWKKAERAYALQGGGGVVT